MSERVSQLAAGIYQEFERMLKKYDEDVVKDLMPLVVSVLENLDDSAMKNQENEVELELLREDNEQLLTQYEREKQLRREAEEKYLEAEDSSDGEKVKLQDKVETMESLVRMLELKNKNFSEQIGRLEEKDTDVQKEFTKLHDRYTDLFRTHMELVEKAKFPPSTPIGGRRSLNLPLRPSSKEEDLEETPPPTPTPISEDGSVKRASKERLEFERRKEKPSQVDRGTMFIRPESLNDDWTLDHRDKETNGFQWDWNILLEESEVVCSGAWESATEANDDIPHMDSGPELDDDEEEDYDRLTGAVAASTDHRNNESIFAELTRDKFGLEDVDDGASITGMSREVENLIMENTELLATKNALNVVKDDLIARVDELNGEIEILKEDLNVVSQKNEKSESKVKDLETEIKQIKADAEKKNEEKEGGEEDVPMAQRKRFTRVEMARVLMERNQYKERLMELQEAVRWTEMIRASREQKGAFEPKKRGSIWGVFSNLFAATEKPGQTDPGSGIGYSKEEGQVKPQGDPNRSSREAALPAQKTKAYDFLQEDSLSEKSRLQRMKEQKEQYKQVRAHVKKDDGRVQAYGWSLPTKIQNPLSSSDLTKTPSNHVQLIPHSKTHVPVPVPVYCRPLLENETTGSKIWCAAGVDLRGCQSAVTRVGGSTFYNSSTEPLPG